LKNKDDDRPYQKDLQALAKEVKRLVMEGNGAGDRVASISMAVIYESGEVYTHNVGKSDPMLIIGALEALKQNMYADLVNTIQNFAIEKKIPAPLRRDILELGWRYGTSVRTAAAEMEAREGGDQ